MRTKNAALRLATVILACGLLATTARTGDFVDTTLPKGMGAHLSVRSTRELLRDMDAGVAAATTGTVDPVPAGTILKWIAQRLPFLMGEDGLDLEMHLFLPPMMHEMAVFGHVLIISNLSLAKFTEVVEKFGGAVAVDKGGIATLTLRGAPPYRIVEAGDDMLALAFQPEILRMLRREFKNGWRPRHWPDGVVGLTVDSPGEWLFASTEDALKRKLVLLGDWLSQETPTPALEKADRDVLLKVLEAVWDAVPAVMAESEGITRLGLDIHVDGGRLGLTFQALSEPTTYLGRVGAAASGRPNLNNPLMRKVDDGAIQILTIAPGEEILPGLGELIVEWGGAVADRAFPDLKDGIVAAGRAYYVEAQSGVSVNAGNFDGEFMRNVVWKESDNPAALTVAWVKVIQAADGLLGAVFPGIDGPIVEVRQSETGGGVPCWNIDWNNDFMDAYWNFSQELTAVLQERPALKMPRPDWMASPSTQLAAGDGFLASLTNPVDDVDAMDMALAAGPAANPFTARKSAAWAVADMRHFQNLLVLTDYNFVTEFLLTGMAATRPGANAPDPERQAKRLARLRSSLLKTDSLVGMAVGGEDGCLIVDFGLPTDTIAALYHNITLMSNAGLLPGSSASGLTANEATAVTCLKNYAVAQITFQVGRQGREAENTGAGEKGYADNYRNLFYGKPAGAPGDEGRFLALISRSHADAFAGATTGIATSAQNGQPTATAVAYNGYLFLEPPGVDFTKSFALVAYPAQFDIGGDKILYIDDEGAVYTMILDKRGSGIPADGEMPAPLSEDETPSANPGLWRRM